MAKRVLAKDKTAGSVPATRSILDDLDVIERECTSVQAKFLAQMLLSVRNFLIDEGVTDFTSMSAKEIAKLMPR